MKKFAFSVLLLLISLPAYAAEYDGLLNDLKALNTKIESTTEVQSTIDADRKYETNPNLFPRGKEYEAADSTLIRKDSISETNVYVRNEGQPVILQDVLLTDWYAPYVRDISEKNIITGYKNSNNVLTGYFGPADKVTRAQLAKIAVLAAKIDTTSCPDAPLNETAANSWAKTYVACAEHNRWSIFIDTTIDINQPATRAEVITTILEAFNRTYNASTGTIFSDVNTSLPFVQPIETAFADGLVSGYKDANGNDTHLFGPFNTIDRASTAKIVSLAMQIYSR